MKKKNRIFVALVLATVIPALAWGEEWPQVRQGEYARRVVQALKIERELPLANNEKDCIALLESYGISPLKGWAKEALLSKDDYTAVVLKIQGEEKYLHKVAQKMCDQAAEAKKEGCPYGVPYKTQADGTFCHHSHRLYIPVKWKAPLSLRVAF